MRRYDPPHSSIPRGLHRAALRPAGGKAGFTPREGPGRRGVQRVARIGELDRRNKHDGHVISPLTGGARRCTRSPRSRFVLGSAPSPHNGARGAWPSHRTILGQERRRQWLTSPGARYSVDQWPLARLTSSRPPTSPRRRQPPRRCGSRRGSSRTKIWRCGKPSPTTRRRAGAVARLEASAPA